MARRYEVTVRIADGMTETVVLDAYDASDAMLAAIVELNNPLLLRVVKIRPAPAEISLQDMSRWDPTSTVAAPPRRDE